MRGSYSGNTLAFQAKAESSILLPRSNKNNMIPKIVHLTWKTKDILDSDSLIIVNGARKLVDMNPDWKDLFWMLGE